MHHIPAMMLKQSFMQMGKTVLPATETATAV